MAKKSPAILIVDDDLVAGELFKVTLEAHGFGNVEVCNDSRNAMNRVRSGPISILLLDLFMPHVSGTEILEQMIREYPYIPVIVLTVDDSVDVAVSCMKTGAFDFMTKPVDKNRLVASVNAAMRVRDLEGRLSLYGDEGETLAEPSHPEIFERIVTRSTKITSLFSYIEAIGLSPRSVLITGESGTGKELLARAVHDAGNLKGEFIAVNVSGLDDTMFTDTLFGHLKGSYTGADTARGGLVESAEGGTLFLDEIGDMELSSQVKLLRLLQEGEYYPLGSDKAKNAHIRVVAATNADLQQRMDDGTFRKDLFYRLISHHIVVPPVRDRKEDIPPLVDFLVEEECKALRRVVPKIPVSTVNRLLAYDFPGNVRELQAILIDGLSRCNGNELMPVHLEDYFSRRGMESTAAVSISYREPFPKLSEVEDFFINEAMKRSEGNQSAAAKLLGISQSTLSRRQTRPHA